MTFSAVVVAVIGAAAVVIAAIVAALFNGRHQRDRFQFDRRAEIGAEESILELLKHPKYPQRKFATIRQKMKGMDEDSLRKLLLQVGAVSFTRRADGAELWGLRSRNLRPGPTSTPLPPPEH